MKKGDILRWEGMSGPHARLYTDLSPVYSRDVFFEVQDQH